MKIARPSIRHPLRLAVALWAMALAALTIALYWPSLALPLSFDDAWSVRLVRDYSALDLFTQTANFGYYRPLYLAYYKLASLAGASGPLLLHVLCIVVHIVNAWLLIGLISVILDRSPDGQAITAAFLFALNPFAVQAVALPAGLNHLLALMFIQIATLLYVEARARRKRSLWLLCGGACVLAFFSNEIGLCVAGFCFMVEAVRAMRERTWSRASWSFLAIVALCVIYAVIYTWIPKGASPAFAFAMGDVLQRALLTLQTLTYPLMLMLAPVGLSAEVTVLVAALALFALCAQVARGHARARDAVILGLGLFAVAVALPVLRLPTGYVQNSPRVFYVSTAGVAIVWAALIAALVAWLVRDGRWRVAAHAGVALIVGAMGVIHVRDQLRFYDRVSEPVVAIAEHGAQLKASQRLLALNMPEWVATPMRRFPLFYEGAIVMARYVEGRDLVLANTGLDREVNLQRFATPFQPELPYSYQSFGEPVERGALPASFDGADRVLWTHYQPDALRTDWIGGIAPDATAQAEAIFDGKLALVQYHVMPCRDGWVVALQWRALAAEAALSPTLSAFVQVLDASGSKLAQRDGAPLHGLLPFNQLPAQRDVLDRRMLALPPGATVGEATLFVGIYDYASGERLPALDAQSKPLDADAIVLALPPLDASVACR